MEVENYGGPLRRGANLADRLLVFGSEVLTLGGRMPRDFKGKHIAQQLIRSATSAGANYEEARAAESPADFVHKLRVAAKEMRETIYWLRLVQQSALLAQGPTLTPLLKEANELAAILMASARTAKSNAPEKPVK